MGWPPDATMTVVLTGKQTGGRCLSTKFWPKFISKRRDLQLSLLKTPAIQTLGRENLGDGRASQIFSEADQRSEQNPEAVGGVPRDQAREGTDDPE